MNLLVIAACAMALDFMVGDPPALPHPVRWMGRFIRWFDTRFNHWQSDEGSAARWKGVVLAAVTPIGAGGLTWLVIWAAARWNPWLGTVLGIALSATTMAWRGLVDAGQRVYQALTTPNETEALRLEAGRRAVAQIVGRDTEHLSRAEVVRAAVETLAENVVDGIVAPVLFAAVGGAPLAMAYRAVNTLDSMVGYRNERYADFGWASARLDDALNYIPARITVLCMWMSAVLLGYRASEAWRVMRRDGRKHPSPNSGLPEALMAGALGVQLGGINYYHGRASRRAYLGDPEHPLDIPRIREAIRMVHGTAAMLWLLLTMGGVGWCFVHGF
ncbi:cobalamin biosynthesis protein CobD [Alicyclobacillus contaminans]|uniref:adenosylcobinamide-phosphate synthase CbiB n=1 Tax=Alicyclobacillus contaminans TaxID=392016 RepID=UPI00040F8761|nr:adenosylcobinamide-phosphate synthase CbiB [Alicyclobacillus contaminans]GMA48778.1 cobalamin biosynthesis protein CobD [Alicyclobacillus contaminans]